MAAVVGQGAAYNRKLVFDCLVLSFACCPGLVALGSADSFVNGFRNFNFIRLFSGSKGKVR